MNIKRDIEMTATVGDYLNGDGAKVEMCDLGIYVRTDESSGTHIEWPIWDALVAEVERYRRALVAIDTDMAVVPVERRA